MSMSWNELHVLQRKLAEWLEPWGAEGNELWREVADEAGTARREHLAWFASQRLASLVAEMHNGMLFLINALIMHERLALDRAKKAKREPENVQTHLDQDADPRG